MWCELYGRVFGLDVFQRALAGSREMR